MYDWTPLAPWALTTAALVLLFAQGWVARRQIGQLRSQLKERCDTLGRELHATGSGSMGVGHRVVACERQLHELSLIHISEPRDRQKSRMPSSA